MAKRPDTRDVSNILNSVTTINNNYDAINTAFDNTLSRDGSTPNQMLADIDLNSNDLINVGSVNTGTLSIGGVNVTPTTALSQTALVISQQFSSVSSLRASTTAYTVGQYVEVVDGDYEYQVVSGTGDVQNASSPATNFNVVDKNGVTPLLAFGPNANGTTDDSAHINRVNTSGRVIDLGGKNYEYSGSFSPTAVFINGTIIDDNRTFDYTLVTNNSTAPVTNGRMRLSYGTVGSVRIFCPPQITMGGFRMFGSYYNARGRVINTGVTGSTLLDSTGAGLRVETAPQVTSWYAVFAGANANDSTVTFTQMPFLRAMSVSGNVITLGSMREADGDTASAVTYNWADNSLVGAEVLIITQGSNWNGRTTTVTANTATTVTLADATGMVALDKFLVAPPGFSDYHYCGTHMIDNLAGESRNMADSGTYVGSSGANIIGIPETGLIPGPTYTRYSLAGLMPPLATSYKLTLSYTIGATETGELLHEFSHDSSDHIVAQLLERKVSTAVENFAVDLDIQFSINQEIYLRTGVSGTIGTVISARRTRTRGWLEP